MPSPPTKDQLDLAAAGDHIDFKTFVAVCSQQQFDTTVCLLEQGEFVICSARRALHGVAPAGTG